MSVTNEKEHHVTALRFPAEVAVGEVAWEDTRLRPWSDAEGYLGSEDA